ncbi:hypothetical protein DMJ13_27095 [halophilic archaeon]|nr:hypothetical protein DMJ13_27095 [halophilic archaeon]
MYRYRALWAHQVQFLSAVSGDSVEYFGADMRGVHKGMGSTDDEFDIVSEHLEAALAENGVSDGAREHVLTNVEELRLEIVEVTESSEVGTASL